MTPLSIHLEENIAHAKSLFPIPKSFDFITRDLYLGSTKGYWIGINGFCKLEVLQLIFSDLQNPLYMQDNTIEEMTRYMNTRIGYAQASLTDNWEDIERSVLSGPSVLFIDGFQQAILFDVRTYPTRSVDEPETEQVTNGARDGFVETMLFNTNLIRRRIRSPKLTFEIVSVGSISKTDVAIAYVGGLADEKLLEQLRKKLQSLKVTTLTMGTRSTARRSPAWSWSGPAFRSSCRSTRGKCPSAQRTGRAPSGRRWSWKRPWRTL